VGHDVPFGKEGLDLLVYMAGGGREDERRSLKVPGESPVPLGQRRGDGKHDGDFPHHVVGVFTMLIAGDGHVREDEVQALFVQIIQQRAQAPLLDDGMGLGFMGKEVAEQRMGKRPRGAVEYADLHCQPSAWWSIPQRVLKFLPQLENALRVIQDRPTLFRQKEPLVPPLKELPAEHVLELLQLGADCGLGEPQGFTGFGDRAALRDHEEVVEVMIVEWNHRLYRWLWFRLSILQTSLSRVEWSLFAKPTERVRRLRQMRL